jgi:CubicO group peptidase (beta-lactamase class C family)
MPDSRQDKCLVGLDAFIRDSLSGWGVPSAAVAVVDKQRVIYRKAFGLADRENEIKAREDTVYYVASCTKAFTAALAGILHDEEVLDWNRPVCQYLKDFAFRDPVATERLTLRDLLSHRTGLARHEWVWMGAGTSRKELARRVQHLDFSADIRTTYRYNNLAYVLAAYVMKQCSGQSWESLVEDRLLKPLGMNDTTVLRQKLPKAEAKGYIRRPGSKTATPWIKGWIAGMDDELTWGNPLAPAGGLNSTLDDMTRWIQFQLGDGSTGDRRILSEDTFRSLHSPHIPIPKPPKEPELLDASYALGWVVQPYRGHRRFWHSGSFGGFNSNASYLPDKNMGVILLTNIDASPLEHVIPFRVYDLLLELKPVDWNHRFKQKMKKAERKHKKVSKKEPPAESLNEYTGVYHHPGYGELVVSSKGGKLAIQKHFAQFSAEPDVQGRFLLQQDIPLTDPIEGMFKRTRSGKINAVTVKFDPEVEPVVFVKRKDP